MTSRNKIILLSSMIILLLSMGCDSFPRTAYLLESGTTVVCRYETLEPCGATLFDCEDGQKYTCQVNFLELD